MAKDARPHPKGTADASRLVKFVRELEGYGTTPAAGAPGHEQSSVELDLALNELLTGANQEIVFYNDSGFRTLSIRTPHTVVSTGRAGKRRTADGADVTGFKFVTFDNGVTLFFEESLDLVTASD